MGPGPFYWNKAEGWFPTQDGSPVLITQEEWEECCCDIHPCECPEDCQDDLWLEIDTDSLLEDLLVDERDGEPVVWEKDDEWSEDYKCVDAWPTYLTYTRIRYTTSHTVDGITWLAVYDISIRLQCDQSDPGEWILQIESKYREKISWWARWYDIDRWWKWKFEQCAPDALPKAGIVNEESTEVVVDTNEIEDVLGREPHYLQDDWDDYFPGVTIVRNPLP